jgi:hypothetical protein
LGTLASVTVAILLPFTPLAHLFQFTALPLSFLAILGLMVVTYLALVELGKHFFFGRLPTRPQLPVERWELPPALQTVERFASRWSVRSRAGGRGLRSRKAQVGAKTLSSGR